MRYSFYIKITKLGVFVSKRDETGMSVAGGMYNNETDAIKWVKSQGGVISNIQEAISLIQSEGCAVF